MNEIENIVAAPVDQNEVENAVMALVDIDKYQLAEKIAKQHNTSLGEIIVRRNALSWANITLLGILDGAAK